MTCSPSERFVVIVISAPTLLVTAITKRADSPNLSYLRLIVQSSANRFSIRPSSPVCGIVLDMIKSVLGSFSLFPRLKSY